MGWVNPNYDGTTGVPNTGDNTPIAFMMFAMVLATGGAFIVIKKRKETFSDDDLRMA